MVARHPLQHPAGVEVPFPVANVALMLPSRTAAEDSMVITYTAISHSSSVASPSMSLERGPVSPESLLTLCNDSWLVREGSKPRGFHNRAGSCVMQEI